jgi:predicted RNA binding protein YcfA (HicA-like mRNA interferase family)
MLRDSRDIIDRLRHDKYQLVSVRGSHHKFVHPVLRRVVIVPHPRKTYRPERCAPSIGKPVGQEIEQ